MLKFRKLWALQQLEEQQEKQQQQKVDPELVNRLKALKAEIEALQGQLKELKDRYQKAKEEVNRLELAGTNLRAKQSQLNEKIYGGSLQGKEIESYQQRLAQVNQELSQAEDEELALMQQRDDIRALWAEKKQRLEECTAQYKALHQTYLRQREEIKARATALAREMTELCEAIGEEDLKLYRQLKKRHRNPLGRVAKDICSGCHLGISFEKLKQLKYQEEPVYCNHCGRLLFLDLD
ncbi:zinc ribbon domain-containing protein [Desulforamulus ferrireducens]|uniref:Uncharacterized protein n=1 Tax=Desulforamulus ferrireducens TaxID=1833852 RepID=A0A1S6IYL4_9FIRM|nr:C4-type zinc ribbon domain-containing protein [Desulforamulus ferrireducens]AQS59873.1 hypothetical protein B0537_12725 [Desulforamulus ferrireducens]